MVVRGDFGWEPWVDQYVGRETGCDILNVAQPPDLGGMLELLPTTCFFKFSPETFFRFLLLLYLQVNEKNRRGDFLGRRWRGIQGLNKGSTGEKHGV